jgi:hypothetical protein
MVFRPYYDSLEFAVNALCVRSLLASFDYAFRSSANIFTQQPEWVISLHGPLN